MTTQLTLHHLEYSQSFRVPWMLEELNAPYDLILYSRDTKTMAATCEYLGPTEQTYTSPQRGKELHACQAEFGDSANTANRAV